MATLREMDGCFKAGCFTEVKTIEKPPSGI